MVGCIFPDQTFNDLEHRKTSIEEFQVVQKSQSTSFETLILLNVRSGNHCFVGRGRHVDGADHVSGQDSGRVRIPTESLEWAGEGVVGDEGSSRGREEEGGEGQAKAAGGEGREGGGEGEERGLGGCQGQENKSPKVSLALTRR